MPVEKFLGVCLNVHAVYGDETAVYCNKALHLESDWLCQNPGADTTRCM